MRKPFPTDPDSVEKEAAANPDSVGGAQAESNRGKKHKGALMPKIFSAALSAFTVFVLLDTFAIARVQGQVQAADLSSITAAASDESGESAADTTNSGQTGEPSAESAATSGTDSAGSSGSAVATGSTGSADSTAAAGSGSTDDSATADFENGSHGKTKPQHGSGRHHGKPGGGTSDGASSSGRSTTSGSNGVSNSAGAANSASSSMGTSAGSTSASTLTAANDVTAQKTDMTYSDENIQVSISTVRAYDTDIYIADVQVSSAEYLKTALAQNAFGRNLKDSTSNIAEEAGAILAINGDYYGFRDDGYVLRNGVLYREQASAGTDALVIYGDGTMASANQSETTAEQLKNAGAWQVLSFGPTLIDGGQIAVSQNDEVDRAMASNPRTAVGMISPLHYIFVVSDGRTDQSTGLSLYQLATVMEQAGAEYAYNLDGGGSSTMWFEGQVVNNPSSGHSSGEREVSDIVYIG